MAKGEAGLELPGEIIQHIQSFLNGRTAAQTTLLSKSWYAAWLTRPNLHFDQDDFRWSSYYDTPQSSETGFWEFIEKTVERYEALNLQIDSLRLFIDDSFYTTNYRNSLVKELIVKALKMGATALDFSDTRRKGEFILPHEVFGSKNLVRLSVSGCKTCIGGDGKVSCSRLKSLNLRVAYVESDLIRDIISSCPLIENLTLIPFNGMTSTEFGKLNVGLFNKLKSLLLSGIDVDALFFHDFSSKFPCLKDLSLDDCGGYNKVIEVSSPSLECISFSPYRDQFLRVKFDVPSIRKFTYSGPIPCLSFKTTSTNWSSEISITCDRSPNAKWILKINKLLTELSQSKVSLSFHEYFGKRFVCAKDIKGLCKPEVENLMFNGDECQHSSELLDALFWCCRPTYVTQDFFQFANCDFMEIVYKRVMQHVGLKGSSASVCGLEEVDVEFFDWAVCAWRPRLVDASTCPEADEQTIRLHLKWRS